MKATSYRYFCVVVTCQNHWTQLSILSVNQVVSHVFHAVTKGVLYTVRHTANYCGKHKCIPLL